MRRKQQTARHRSLSGRQREIMDFLRRETRRLGYPPSVREIGAAVGLSSSSSVHAQLRALEGKGYLKRHSSKSRALELVAAAPTQKPLKDRPGTQAVREVPLVGRVAAGMPILAQENIEDMVPISAQVAPPGSFFLRVKGDSMVGAGINDGDLLLVRPQKTAENGEIVVALMGDEATVKRFFLENGQARLQPENPGMKPIYTKNLTLVGKVVAVLRTL